MPAPQPDGQHQRESRLEVETRLLAELRQVEAAFQNAAPEEKETVRERYRVTLERFNAFILGGKMPPGSAGEP